MRILNKFINWTSIRILLKVLKGSKLSIATQLTLTYQTLNQNSLST